MRDNSLRSGERQVAPILDGIEITHQQRYQRACEYLKETDNVLDLCCGTGYGAYIMSPYAKEIMGIDISEEAISFAKEHYSLQNIFYLSSNVPHICIPKVDIIICFEGIEHIEDTDELFKLFKRIHPRLFIISTPHLLCPMGGNKFHFRHFGFDELLQRFWDIGYKPKLAETTWYKGGLNIFYIGEKR